jgi:hypothetical protein
MTGFQSMYLPKQKYSRLNYMLNGMKIYAVLITTNLQFQQEPYLRIFITKLGLKHEHFWTCKYRFKMHKTCSLISWLIVFINPYTILISKLHYRQKYSICSLLNYISLVSWDDRNFGQVQLNPETHSIKPWVKLIVWTCHIINSSVFMYILYILEL